MSVLRLGLSAYQRLDLPRVTLKNLFYESTPANLNDQVSILPRPRLKRFAVVSNGPIRGLYREGGVLANVGHSGAIIALSGSSLYRVTQAGLPGVGIPILIGTVEGPLRMTAEGNANVVVLTAGTQPYTTNGDTLTEIAFPDDLQVSAVDTLDSRFLFASEFGRFYWSAPGVATVDPLAFAEAESQADALMTLKVADDVVWLFGRVSIEPWAPTGDQDLPYQRIEGRVFGIGCTSRETVMKMNVGGLDTVCWVGTDRKVYRLQPDPTTISDYGMDERLLRADPATMYAEVVNWSGHDFYLLHVPGEGSWAYDLATGFWAEWTNYGRSLFRTGSSTTGPNAQSLMGDATNGNIYELSLAEITDFGGDPVVFEATGIINKAKRVNNVVLHCSTGSTASTEADPMMQCDLSDDDGATFFAMPDQPLQRQGNRNHRVMWTRFGMSRVNTSQYRLLRFRSTEPVTITTAEYNVAYR